MVPDIAAKGHSFKGAFAYYLHDKGAQTAERVAWTQTRNLMTDDPAAASRVMIATAMQADELKRQAGVRSSGRKSTAHVYAYSLAWHPDEAAGLSKADMLAAVDQSLKELKAEHLQAVIVCHTDQKHPHVHVILNRVDPADGRMHGFKNDRLKLSDWANRYERERGAILTPKREEKRQDRMKNADREQRRHYARTKKAEAASRDRSEMSEASILRALQEDQRSRHRQEWKDYAAAAKQRRRESWQQHRAEIAAAIARHKAQAKPKWRALFEEERARRDAFERRERSLLGRLKNAVNATAHQHLRGELDGRGRLAETFRNVLSANARAAAFTAGIERDKQDRADQINNPLDREIRTLKAAYASQRDVDQGRLDAARQELIGQQDQERATMREAWRQLRTRQSMAQSRREKPVKRDFDRSRTPTPDKPKDAPTASRGVSTPSPAPSPSGDVPRTTTRQTSVPKKDWTKTPDRSTKGGLDGVKPAKKDWSKIGASAQKVVPPKDWTKKAEKTERPVKAPSRSFDRDR